MMDPAPELLTRRIPRPLPVWEPELPHAGVVWVESITPGNGEDGVQADAGVTVELRCLAQLQDELVSVEVGGATATTTANTLAADPAGMIRSGSVRVDRRAVDYGVLCRWYEGEALPVTVEVSYHGWALPGSVTFTPVPPEDWWSSADAWFELWATEPGVTSAGANAEVAIIEIWHGEERTVECVVSELSRYVAADVQFIIGERYVERMLASGIVGGLEVIRWSASGLVEGWRLDRYRASGVVQGWKLLRAQASGVVGIRFVYRHRASGLVGVETLRRIAASGVVYGVVRDNVLEVHVLSESSYTALTAAGVVWS
jgi:hypothetical protein